MRGVVRAESGRFTRCKSALERFREKCRFEPETGCVVWIGGTTMGRGHHIPYPSFWFEGRRWFGHRWAAKFIHKIDIDSFHVDHCCPYIPIPNTLCVEHVRALTPRDNSLDAHERRKRFIHMQVGLESYEDFYGPLHQGPDPEALIPFFEPPAWLRLENPRYDDCPF